MRRGVVQTQVERPLPSSPDEVDRTVGQQVGEISHALDGFQVLPEIFFVGAGLVREVIAGAAQNPEELVETVAIGAELRLPAKVPFPDERGVVSIGLQQGRDGWMVGRQAFVLMYVVPKGFI